MSQKDTTQGGSSTRPATLIYHPSYPAPASDAISRINSYTYEHPFWYVNNRNPEEYWNYENAEVEYNSVQPYEVVQKIGHGKYSEVFRGYNRYNGETCVLKVLKPVKIRKIHREITILQHLCGGPNVVRLLDVVRDEESKTPVLITEYIGSDGVNEGKDFRTLSKRFTNFDCRYYLYELLRCLHFAHSRGIFHRDIKPHNIMIDAGKRKVRIIDWGLGEYYLHGTPYNVQVATRHYKGPELLVDYRLYDYSLDIWCLGIVFAGILFKKDPFLPGKDNEDQLKRIVQVLGKTDFTKFVKKYKGYVPRSVRDWISSSSECAERVEWTSFITKENAMLCEPDALDLLDKMLQYDPHHRILAHDAMMHPYFAPLRERLQEHPQEQYPTVPQPPPFPV